MTLSAVGGLLLTRGSPTPTAEVPSLLDESGAVEGELLVVQGSRSGIDALKVGAAIEEIDILDLEERLAQTDKEDTSSSMRT